MTIDSRLSIQGYRFKAIDSRAIDSWLYSSREGEVGQQILMENKHDL
jgi:hypothetical protein